MLQELLTRLSDLIFPPTHEEVLLRTATPQQTIQLYRPSCVGTVTSLAYYDTPLVQAAIKAHKFQHSRRALTILVTLLDSWISTQSDDLYFVPVPLSNKRFRERGYNQVTEVLTHSSQQPKIVTALRRTRDTAPQTSLNKEKRLQNVSQAFSVTRAVADIPDGSTVVLCDDVHSTGATMRAAKAALLPSLPANTTLICLTLAH